MLTLLVIGGLVVSFEAFTLLGGALLSLLHLPQDLLRWIGIRILSIVGLGLALGWSSSRAPGRSSRRSPCSPRPRRSAGGWCS